MKNKHIHFIGIGGTAMASIAVAFRSAGFLVTGSEPHEIFPPM
ncbi:MAG: Mur ligase domain-containing protein, partial [Patescibacteria group bacterium]